MFLVPTGCSVSWFSSLPETKTDLPSWFFSFTPLSRQIVSQGPACAAQQRPPTAASRTTPHAQWKAELQWGMKEREAGVGDGRRASIVEEKARKYDGTALLFQSENAQTLRHVQESGLTQPLPC